MQLWGECQFPFASFNYAILKLKVEKKIHPSKRTSPTGILHYITAIMAEFCRSLSPSPDILNLLIGLSSVLVLLTNITGNNCSRVMIHNCIHDQSFPLVCDSLQNNLSPLKEQTVHNDCVFRSKPLLSSAGLAYKELRLGLCLNTAAPCNGAPENLPRRSAPLQATSLSCFQPPSQVEATRQL